MLKPIYSHDPLKSLFEEIFLDETRPREVRQHAVNCLNAIIDAEKIKFSNNQTLRQWVDEKILNDFHFVPAIERQKSYLKNFSTGEQYNLKKLYCEYARIASAHRETLKKIGA